MRKSLLIAIIGAATLGSTAALADWHKPYIYREANGDWMHFTYNDGLCYYNFERNGSETSSYHNGDCSHVAFQGDHVVPLYAVPDENY